MTFHSNSRTRVIQCPQAPLIALQTCRAESLLGTYHKRQLPRHASTTLPNARQASKITHQKISRTRSSTLPPRSLLYASNSTTMADKLPMEMILEVLFASAIVSMETLLTASQITRDYRNCYTAHKTRLLLTVAQLSEYSEYIMTYGFLLSKYSYKEYISALHAIPSQFKPAVPRASQGFTAGAPSLLAWLREKGEEDMEGVYIRALEVHCSIQQVAKKCADYTAVIYQNHLISRLENRERASILRLYETDRELCIKAAYLTACHTARVGRTGTLGEICTRTLNATSQFVRFMQLVVIEAIRESGDEPIDYLRKLWCEAVASACVKYVEL